ncbi:hypothetical protein K2X33_15945 [bacterium]|nr:hypothetical protein [bacterium]
MKVLSLFCASFLVHASGWANPKHPDKFFSAKDFALTRGVSQVKIRNSGASAQTVYSLYVRQLSYVTPGQSCTSATVIYPSSDNVAAGAMAMPVSIPANSDVVVGSNYLYNLIHNAYYYVNITIPSSPPGCQVPGCTWGGDTTTVHWCIYLGAMAPVTSTTSAKVVPHTDSLTGAGYNYDLISSYNYIGPISCDDQELTCTVASEQSQSF